MILTLKNVNCYKLTLINPRNIALHFKIFNTTSTEMTKKKKKKAKCSDILGLNFNDSDG